MQNLAQIAPILGAYDRSPVQYRSALYKDKRAQFGNPGKSRYAYAMTSDVLQWSSEERGSAVVLSPKGRVDETSADAFKEQLISAVEKGPKTAVIDLSGIAYMSSRGLRGLTLAKRAADQSGTTIVLASPNDTMREILAISRYDQIFDIANSTQDAIQGAKPS